MPLEIVGNHVGELDKEVLSETALHPETRKLIEVNVDDAEKMIDSLETWMGTNIDERKDFISNNLYKYIEELD